MDSNPPASVPTPRTDAKRYDGQAEWAEDNAMIRDCVDADFARTLERENTALVAERDSIVKMIAHVLKEAKCESLGQLKDCWLGVQNTLNSQTAYVDEVEKRETALRSANAELVAALDAVLHPRALDFRSNIPQVGIVTSKPTIERAEALLASHAAQKAGGA
jgi:hypothetical protein